MAIIWATKQFRPYLLGRKFKIITDHRPLVWLNSLKEPNSKLIRWRLKLEEFNYTVEYKKGCQNVVADALSRIKPEFKIEYKNSNIFESNKTLTHCISKDKQMSKGFAQQVKENYPCKNYHNIDNKILIQTDPRLICHLITKENHSDKPTIRNIKICLEKLLDYCTQNEIDELDMPKICSGLDRKNWSKIENIIKEIFQNSNIKINIYKKPNSEELNLNSDTDSVIVQAGSETDTVHSDDENPINGLIYLETPINTCKNQIVVKETKGKNEIKITKLFNHKIQRIYLYLNKIESNKTIMKFIKEYLQPGMTYYCLIPKNFKSNFNSVLQTYFDANSYKLISCKTMNTDIESKEEQQIAIKNYHEGKTNHRGITETYNKLKQIYYWPNMQKDIQNFINKCNICLTTKYERNPIQIPNIQTPTADKPFEKLHIDLLSLEQTKILTIIDSFSKFAVAYVIKDKNAITVLNKLIKYFTHFTTPKEITSDNGLEFNNKTIQNYLALRHIDIHYISIDNPKSNGIVERFHSSLVEHMRIINQNPIIKTLQLKERLNYALIAYNNSIHSTTKRTPLEIVFGQISETNLKPEEIQIDEYLQKHAEILKQINKQVKSNIEQNKLKYSKPIEIEHEIPEQAYVKINKRNSGKIEKPKFKILNVKTIVHERGQIVDTKDKKHKISNLKTPRLVTD